ncbi:MAG: hypothetical protein KDD33_01900 [Bdellovibrionales bacterium]|nr:hypothetical protein [Bdellovibrionales bacterium]
MKYWGPFLCFIAIASITFPGQANSKQTMRKMFGRSTKGVCGGRIYTTSVTQLTGDDKYYQNFNDGCEEEKIRVMNHLVSLGFKRNNLSPGMAGEMDDRRQAYCIAVPSIVDNGDGQLAARVRIELYRPRNLDKLTPRQLEMFPDEETAKRTMRNSPEINRFFKDEIFELPEKVASKKGCLGKPFIEKVTACQWIDEKRIKGERRADDSPALQLNQAGIIFCHGTMECQKQDFKHRRTGKVKIQISAESALKQRICMARPTGEDLKQVSCDVIINDCANQMVKRGEAVLENISAGQQQTQPSAGDDSRH